MKRYSTINTIQGQDYELVRLLSKRQSELNSLLEVTQAINNNNPSSVLFGMIELILKINFKIGKMRLMVKDGEHFYCLSKFGGVYESAKTLDKMCRSLNFIDSFEPLIYQSGEQFFSYDFLIPALHKNDILAFILIGDCDKNTDLLNNDLNFIQTLINVVIVALENKKLFKERRDREFMQRDIDLAREVQKMLVPLHLPIDDAIEVDALYLPNQNIGGDYFDFIRLNDNEFLWCIADVSGKGMAAALLMANLQASIRARVSIESDLVKIITKLNTIVSNNTKGERFITLFLAKYDQRTREMTYINAGHNPPVLLMGGEAFLLRQGTTMLGAFDDLPFINIAGVKLLPDSVIFNYTDGLVESADEDVFIVEEELVEYVKAGASLPVSSLNNAVLKGIQTTHKAKMNSDDITLLSLKIF